MRNDKAQMMVLEAIFFAITVIIALILLFQMSPISIQSGAQSSNELKMLGDDALDTIYAETLHIKQNMGNGYITNNPSKKLVVCVITNNYTELTDSLNSILPDTVLYNIYISNGSKTVFWCTSAGGTDKPLTMLDPIALSHYSVSIDHQHLNYYPPNYYINLPHVIAQEFYDYKGASYEVILEMSYIWVS